MKPETNAEVRRERARGSAVGPSVQDPAEPAAATQPGPAAGRVDRRGRSVWVAAGLVPGVELDEFGAAFVVAAAIAVFNAVLPPLVAALRLPFTLVARLPAGAVGRRRAADAGRRACSRVRHAWTRSATRCSRRSSWPRSPSSLAGRCSGTNDDDEYTLRVMRRIARARRAGEARTDVPGIVFLEIDGLALPVLRRGDARRERAGRWHAGWPRAATAWPSGRRTSPRRPGASQAGILLGSNEDIPAFRWVEKETGRLMACSSPGGLRGDRAAALDGRGPARRRRREPRQPALGRRRRGDPHRQPHGRREGREPRLPGLLRRTAST